MSELKIRLPAPHPVQKKILDRASRFNAVAMGEHGGKTTLGIEVLIASKKGVLSSSHPVAWFSATKPDLDEARRIISRALDPCIKKRDSKKLELKNGNFIYFFSFDEVRDVSTQFGLIVVDDAAKIENIYSYWQDMLRETLREFGGDAWFLSGAHGKNNDFYRIWSDGNRDASWSCWQFDSFCNPYLSQKVIDESRRADLLEYQQRYCAEFHDVGMELSVAQRVILPDETFYEWCLRLAETGLKVDGKPFTLDDRPAMAWIYKQVPSTKEEAFKRVLVIMKCTQVGFTIMEMLAVIYLGIKFGPSTVGMFLPDMNLAGFKSSERFMPIVKTIPEAYKLMTHSENKTARVGDGNVRTRRMGNALFVFSWTSGRATTESVPMDILSFDEVQEMTLEQMEKTKERLSGSKVRFTLMGSTAKWPDADIHYWYKRGSQFRFHTRCPSCGNSKPLDDYFPDCIKYDPITERHRYVCAESWCGAWIDDPQIGEWIADNIKAESGEESIRSIHFPQFLSPTITPGDIIFAYNNATDMQNFFNRKLGKPYLDPTQVPVTLEHMARCVEAGRAAGVVWKSRARGCFMGIDQMGNFNVVVIKERLPDGRQAVVHVEEIYSADPFLRCDELMESYGVAVAVVEINPNYNDAKRFANRFPGRVFICNSFGSVVEGMILWGDAPRMDASDRRTDDAERDRFTLRMDQYKCMQVSMARFTGKDPICLMPDPQGLVQEVIEKGIRQTVAVLPRMFHHFTKTALVAEKDDETNQYRRSVKKVGIDPHFSYANMLCDVAWARSHGTSTFIIPQSGATANPTLATDDIGVPDVISSALEQLQISRDEVCGCCINRCKDGFCNEINMMVKSGDAGCIAFIAVP